MSGRRACHRLRGALIGADTLALVLAVGLVWLVRLALNGSELTWQLATGREVLASAATLPILLLLFQANGLYDLDQILVGTREYARIANAATYGVLIAVAASYFAGREPLISRTWLVLTWTLVITTVFLARFSTRRVVRHLRRCGSFRTRVVVIGASPLGISIAEQLRAAQNEGLDVVGFLDEYVPLGYRLLGQISVIGRPDELIRGRVFEGVDEYVLVPEALPHERLEALAHLVLKRGQPTVKIAVGSIELLTNGILVSQRGGVPLVTIQRARITGIEAVLKRGLDVVGALLAMALLGPFAAGAVITAFLTGRRPLFVFREIRGAGGQQIKLWLLGPAISNWLPLRGVPGLLMVLSGQMSLVGPRPSSLQPVDVSRKMPCLAVVKPGLTGPWRLTGRHASLADQATQDIAYVRSYTVWEDLRILWRSILSLRSPGKESALVRWQQAADPCHYLVCDAVTAHLSAD